MKLKSGLSFSFVFKFLFEGFKRALIIVLFSKVGEVTGLEDDAKRDLAFEDRFECPLVVLGSFAFGLLGDADFEVAGLVQSYTHDSPVAQKGIRRAFLRLLLSLHSCRFPSLHQLVRAQAQPVAIVFLWCVLFPLHF